jgi:hypothetical protein
MVFRISGCVVPEGLFAGKSDRRTARSYRISVARMICAHTVGARFAREGVRTGATNSQGYSNTALICRKLRSIQPRSIAPHSRIR